MHTSKIVLATMIVAGAAACALSGCAAEVAPGPGEDTGTTAAAMQVGGGTGTGGGPGTSGGTGSPAPTYTVIGDPWYLQHHGGTGGSPTWPQCEPGNLVVGIWGATNDQVYGQSYDFVTRFGLICATLESNGTLSPSWTNHSVGGAANWIFYDECPAGQVVTGFSGSAATYVDRVGIQCTPVTEINNAEAYGHLLMESAAGSSSSYQLNGEFGGSGGNEFNNDSCPTGYAVSYGIVGSGTYIDYFQMTCQYIQVT
jgi:hypothetical protein